MNPTIPHHITLSTLTGIFVKKQLSETLGIQFTEVGKDFIRATLTVDERHLRPGNIMNGGVSLALIETLGSVSSFCFVDPTQENALGIQVTANHLAVARPGDVLNAISKPVHVGKTTHVWEVNIFNQNDKLISTGRITMLITKTKEIPL